jgi:hypothetical protein
MHAHRPALRLLALVLGALVLLAAGFAAQRNLHVCKASGVVAAAGAEHDCCGAETNESCCKAGECKCASHGHAPQARNAAPALPTDAGTPDAKDGGCDSGCCIAVALHVDNGPLPRNLELDHNAPFCGLVAHSSAPPEARSTSELLPLATGPPRDDPGVALRRTVQLLI